MKRVNMHGVMMDLRPKVAGVHQTVENKVRAETRCRLGWHNTMLHRWIRITPQRERTSKKESKR